VLGAYEEPMTAAKLIEIATAVITGLLASDD